VIFTAAIVSYGADVEKNTGQRHLLRRREAIAAYGSGGEQSTLRITDLGSGKRGMLTMGVRA